MSSSQLKDLLKQVSSKTALARAQRDIKLGLERITRLIPKKQTWKGIHVAGTNGKGSVCGYLDGLLAMNGLSHGRFISPAFPERYHAVTINGRNITAKQYDQHRARMERRWQKAREGMIITTGEDPGNPTPFEYDTGVAFDIFNETGVQWGVVEVGMGGDLDATNAMHSKEISIITKIDYDHAEYLGDTIEDIAKTKAGIMQKDVPCIVDVTNIDLVKDVLKYHARRVGTSIIFTKEQVPFLKETSPDGPFSQLEPWQLANMRTAITAFSTLFPTLPIDMDKLLSTQKPMPGRLEKIQIPLSNSSDKYKTATADAAHNLSGVESLASHVNVKLRKGSEPVTWLMGLSSSSSRPPFEMMDTLIQPQDNLAFVQYTQRSTDPAPVPLELGTTYAAHHLANPATQLCPEPTASSIPSALQWACSKAGPSGPLVIAGSLYLVRDVYADETIKRPSDSEILPTSHQRLPPESELLDDDEADMLEQTASMMMGKGQERRQWDGLNSEPKVRKKRFSRHILRPPNAKGYDEEGQHIPREPWDYKAERSPRRKEDGEVRQKKRSAGKEKPGPTW